MKRADCADLHFHDLRHEAVARFFERTKLQTMEFALIAGHTELKTLQRYANLRPSILATIKTRPKTASAAPKARAGRK